MRIAYIVPKFPALSETFIWREVHALKEMGQEVSLHAFQAPTAEEAEKLGPSPRELAGQVEYVSNARILREIPQLPRQGRRVWEDNERLHKASRLKSRKLLRLLRALAIARAVESSGTQHIHAHWPYATQIAYLVSKLTGIPFSVAIHAHEVEHDYGHIPVVFDSVEFAVFCNQAALDRLIENVPSASERCHLVYHGVDLDQFRPLPLPVAAVPLHVISAGRLTRTKGFDRLVRGCARLNDAGVDIRLTILGTGEIKSELRALAVELGFDARLSLPGWVPYHRVPEHTKDAQVFALMADTSYDDGLPNVLLEAMACGRPVITSPLPAAGEAITNGVEGYILESADDIGGLVSALNSFAAQPSQLRRMGAAARRRVEAEFDVRRQIPKLMALISGEPSQKALK